MANDVRAGGIYTEFTARTDGLEAAARRSGVIVKRSADEIERETRRASRAVSGMGVAADGRRPDGTFVFQGQQYASPRDWAMQRPLSTTQTGRGNYNQPTPMPPASTMGEQGGAGRGSFAWLAAANLAAKAWVASFVAQTAFRAGESVSPLVQEYAVGGREYERRISAEDRDIDPTSRTETLQARLDKLYAERGSQMRNFDSILGVISHARTFGVKSLFRSGELIDERTSEVEEEIRGYANQNRARRAFQRRLENRSFVREQQENQTSGRFSFQELIMANRENTEVLNLVASRLQR